jgi:hypothetical protein
VLERTLGSSEYFPRDKNVSLLRSTGAVNRGSICTTSLIYQRVLSVWSFKTAIGVAL